MRAKIVKKIKTGCSVGDSYYFTAESEYPITRDEAKALQIESGQHPGGYGFYQFLLDENDNGLYVATWNCSASCD